LIPLNHNWYNLLMFRRAVLIIFFISLFPFPVSAVSKTIVIYSFKVAGTKSTDEFVEIKNIGTEKVGIGGWQLAKITASGTKYNLVTSFQSIDIMPGSSLIIGHADSSEPHDIAYSTGYSLAEDNTIVLFSDAGKTVVDKVGYGKATSFEGTVMPSAGTDTWARLNGIDTDNNLNDFQKEGQIIEGAKDYSGICLTEMMPDPGSGGEEWIEIYNSEVTKDISGLVIGDKLGSTKKYTVPAGTIIEEGKYLVFYGGKTGIALNNDGDGVVLIDSDGSILDDSGESYGTTKQGLSYAFDGERWQWSKSPTPGSQNIISIDNEEGGDKKTKKAAVKKPKATKGKAPKAEVLGKTSEGEDVFGSDGSNISENDRLLGYILIGVAILGGLLYTIFVNREKLLHVFKHERKKYHKSWLRLRQKMSGWRDIPFIRRIRGR
jgi:hypothetical protein